jgi:hypothetical protein
VTFAGPGQSAGQQLYEATVPVGVVMSVRVEAATVSIAGYFGRGFPPSANSAAKVMTS